MKSILITGASSGLGEALALYYATPQTTLFICGRDEKRLDDVTQKCTDKGATVHAKIIDVANKEAMHKWVLSCDEIAPLNLVIANAGVGGEDNPDLIFDINMNGVINTIHPILPKMLGQQSGQIALISSLAGYRGLPSAPAYSASKCFVKAYGEALRGKHKNNNIDINVVCPGFVRSRITDQNNFKMPGFMEANQAAEIIAKGLAKNKPIIGFPWYMVFGSWFLSILPASLFQWVAGKLPSK